MHTPTSIFISYKREDELFARRLHSQLRSWGYQVWLDVIDIHPGDDWDSSIHQAMQAAQIVIGVITPASLASRNVLDEWGYALSNNKTLLLLWLKDVAEEKIPPRYIRLQRIDFRQDEGRGLEHLRMALSGGPAPVSHVTPQRKAVWMPVIILAVCLGLLLVGAFLIFGNGDNADEDAANRATATPDATQMSSQSPVPSATDSPSATITPSNPPTETASATDTSTQTPSATLTLTSPPQASATPTPSPSHTLAPPSFTPTPSNLTYPCNATIVNVGSQASTLSVVRAEPSGASTLLAPIRVGTAVQITERRGTVASNSWYRILEPDGSFIGWIPIQYASLAGTCPQ